MNALVRLVTLGLLGASAWVVAATINLVTASQLERPSRVALTAALRADPPRTPLDGRRLGRLFGLPDAQKRPEPVTSAPARSPLAVTLLGTLLADDPDWSVALIGDGGRARSVMNGDPISDARVVAIERERIVVEREGHLEFVERGSAPPQLPTGPTPVNIQ